MQYFWATAFHFWIVGWWFLYFLINLWITYLVPGTADDGGEDSPGGIITSETSLAHAGAIVNDESSNVLISHFGFVLLKLRLCHTTTADLGLSKKSKICVWHQLSFGPAHTPFQLTKVAKITPVCHNAHTQMSCFLCLCIVMQREQWFDVPIWSHK